MKPHDPPPPRAARRRGPAALPLLAALATTALASCGVMRERGEVQAFQTSVVMDDGQTTVFTANRALFEYAGGDSWGKGEKIFRSDKLLIGTYDLENGAARVLHVEDAEPGSAGWTRYWIKSTRGPYVLLSRACARRVEDKSRAGWYLFDVPRGELRRLDLARDLAARGAGEIGAALLVSDEGDVVTFSRPVEGQERRTISLRRPDGTWEEVATDASWHGVRDDELYFWSPGAPLQAWSLATSTRRDVQPPDHLGLDYYRETKPKATVMPRKMQHSTGSYLELFLDRPDGGSDRRRLPLRVEDLDVP